MAVFRGEIGTAVKHLGPFEDEGITVVVWALGAYIVAVPSLTLLPGVGPFNEKRALQIGVLLAGALALLVSPVSRRSWLKTVVGLPSRARWGLGLVLVLGILSSALAPAPFYAFLELGHVLLLFVLAGIVATAVRKESKQTAWLFLGSIGGSALLYAVYVAVAYGAYLTTPDVLLWPDGQTNFANVRIFNQYQTWTLPLLAGGVTALPKTWKGGKGVLFGLVVLWWTLIFASSVRGTVLAMIVATAGIGLLFRWEAKRWIVVQIFGLCLGLGVYLLLFSGASAPPVTERFTDAQQYFRRLKHWQRCLEMAWAHPVLGAGPMHFAWPPYHYSVGASPHNALMQWLAEWGIPSTLVMSSLTVWGGYAWMRREREDHVGGSRFSDAMRVSLVAAALAGAAHSMVSGLTLAPLSQMLLVLVGGWAWGRYQGDVESSLDAGWGVHGGLCLLLVGSMLVVGASYKDLADAYERRKAFVESVERDVLSPRYWAQGYIGVRDPDVIERARRDK